MALVVARQENHRRARDLAHPQRRRRLSPRALDAPLPHLLQSRQIVDAGAANDAKHGFGHYCPLTRFFAIVTLRASFATDPMVRTGMSAMKVSTMSNSGILDTR